jgi:hypothetical protein
MGFNITKKYPSVSTLSIHDSSCHGHLQYQQNNSKSSLSTLNHYFARPLGTFVLSSIERSFDDLTYAEYFSFFRFDKRLPHNDNRPGYFIEQSNSDNQQPRHVILRAATKVHLSRLQSVRPSQGELFYLRALLQIRPARSFLELRTVDGCEYPTYQQAATHLGLFADKNEAVYTLAEAVHALKTPRQLRLLFVHLLVNDCAPTPIDIWEQLMDEFAKDFTLRYNGNLHIGRNHALRDIALNLEEHGKSLADYGLPDAELHSLEVEHELMRWCSNCEALAQRADIAYANLNPEQRLIFDEIMYAVHNNLPLRMFIDGKAGRGKTYLIQALCDRLRSMYRIVIPTATSAFAAHHYQGGRTTHSAFKVCTCTPIYTLRARC